MERKAGAWLLSLLLLAGWLAQHPALALPREDTLTVFVEEFLEALNAIYREGFYDKEVKGRVLSTEVVYKAGGPEKLKEALKQWIGEDLANQVVEKLQGEPGRYFDHWFAKGKFKAFVEIKKRRE